MEDAEDVRLSAPAERPEYLIASDSRDRPGDILTHSLDIHQADRRTEIGGFLW